MNILYIVPYQFSKPTGGGKFAIFNQIKYISKIATITIAGVAANEATPEFDCNMMPVFSNAASRYINLLKFFTLRNIIRENKIQLIILEHPYMAPLGILLQKLCGVKFAIRSQNVEYLRFKDMGKWWWRILQMFEKWAHNQADAVLCITEDDKAFFKNQGVKSKLIDFPFGTCIASSPLDKFDCKQQILKQHQLSSDTKIILYNGTLNYLPNVTGLDIILDHVNPYLQEHLSNYKIIICGSKLPEKYNALIAIPNVIYCGFVEDIGVYFKGADVFINPVQGGGGIKTKLVEALAYGTTTISSKDGAKGLIQSTAVGKLIITPDFDGITMAKKIIEEVLKTANIPTPKSYYDYYYWPNIAQKVVKELEAIL